MNPARIRAWPSALLHAWLRACTVPDAHAASPLATAPDAALAALRVHARAGTRVDASVDTRGDTHSVSRGDIDGVRRGGTHGASPGDTDGDTHLDGARRPLPGLYRGGWCRR
ncbi:hypothetical protein GCM10010341_74530 [Streptomyces noursei]|nr:hypothetical protein GCM10010341_74530 [Streptomyces noursei]